MAAGKRHRKRHPGVVLMKPDEKRRIGWRARYVNPDTGNVVKVSLDPALRTAELREDWAARTSRDLSTRRLELDRGATPASGTGLDAALDRYFVDHPQLRAATVEAYRSATRKLALWCKENRVKSADDLVVAKLVAFRAELVKEPKRQHLKGGKRGALRTTAEPRSPYTVNRELRSVRTVLGYLRRLGLCARLSTDDLRDGLERLSTGTDRVDYRRPAELQKLLEAASRHDADTFAATREEHAGVRPAGSTARYAPIAPFVAAALLTGMRFGELIDLQWKQVDLDALDNEGRTVGEIHLSSATKTKRARTVGLEVSLGLRKMLAAMHLKGGGKGTVFGLTRGEAKAAEKRLRTEYGAPDACNWQALRRTCGTYLTNAPGIFGAASAYRSAKQLGHSVLVAEKHYVDVLRGIPRDARTLEAAMQIEAQVKLIIDAVRTRAASRLDACG